jgi:hypothetical protein
VKYKKIFTPAEATFKVRAKMRIRQEMTTRILILAVDEK